MLLLAPGVSWSMLLADALTTGEGACTSLHVVVLHNCGCIEYMKTAVVGEVSMRLGITRCVHVENTLSMTTDAVMMATTPLHPADCDSSLCNASKGMQLAA